MSLLGQIPDPTNVIDTASKYSWEAGVLAFVIISLVCGLGVIIWKFGWYMVYKIFGNEEKGTRGTLGEWVDRESKDREANTEALKKLTERLDVQTKVCIVHGDAVKAVVDASQRGSEALMTVEKLLEERTPVIQNTCQGVEQLKSVAFHLCDMCQAFVAREFPNSLGEVSAYCMAIKKKINDEKVA